MNERVGGLGHTTQVLSRLAFTKSSNDGISIDFFALWKQRALKESIKVYIIWSKTFGYNKIGDKAALRKFFGLPFGFLWRTNGPI